MVNHNCEDDKPINNLIADNNSSSIEVFDFRHEALLLMPDRENQEIGNEEIEFEILDDEPEPTPESLALLKQIEIYDEYFHSCGRW